MTFTTSIDVDIDAEEVVAEIRKWSDGDKRQLLADIGLNDGQPEAFLPFIWPKRHELADIIEPFLPDTPSKPAKWLALDIADAVLGQRVGLPS